MSDPIEELLTAYSPQVRDLALRLRALVLELQPDAVEQVDTADKLIGYGKGRKMASLVCVIIPYRNWVNLGFARGTELPDPHGRLIGSGKHARHVKVASTEDIDPAVLRPLLEAAWAKLSVQGASHSALNRKGAWMRAIISVSDKRGIVELAQQLAEIGGTGFELYSTGGTKAALEQGGVAVKSISELTNFPEIMDGRVKTLHPAVYSGILARRDKAEHMAALANLGLPTIDLVVVNLYPFVETIHQPQTDLETAIENIDIGGPAMIRAAAKNHESVIVLVDPADYAAVVAELRQGGVSPATRRQLAAKAYQHTASYDTYIAQYLRGSDALPGQPLPLPEEFSVSLRQVEEMRYGENPHQRAAVYADSLGNPIGTLIGNLRQLNGKQLSYNNILDADAALEIVRDFAAPTVVIIKHNNPCGLASGDDLRDNYARALAGDPVSAYGGIVGVNRPVDAALAEDIAGTFYEVVIAPSFSNAAVDTLARKKNLRVLEVGELPTDSDHDRVLQLRQVSGGFLVQDRDVTAESDVPMKIVTTEHPSLEQVNDLLFAWRAVKHVKSNAIVLAKGRAILGIGPGQPNRVDSVRLAVSRAGERAAGSVLASDAFFPFPDGVEEAAKAGVKAVIQPGGSVHDDEVTAIADEYGIAMVFTGRRHFKH